MKLSKNIQSFITDSAIYTILNLLNKSIPFVLLPIIIRVLSKEDFGMYSLLCTVETMLIPIVTLNIHVAISSHFYRENLNLKSYISTISAAICCFLFVFFVLFSFLPTGCFHFSGLAKPFFLIAVLTASIMGLVSMISNLYRLERKPFKYGIYVILQSLLLLIIIMIFSHWKGEFAYLAYGKLLFSILILLITLGLLLRNGLIKRTFNKEYFSDALNFALPTVVYSISAFVFLSSDRFLINYFLGVENVSNYAAIYQLASMMSILGMSVNAAWMPWLFEQLKKEKELINIVVVKVSYSLVFLFFMSGIIFSLVFPFLGKIILPATFHQFFPIAYPLIFGFVFEGVYLVVSPYLFYKNKTKYNGIIGVFIAIFNLSINILLIPIFGIYGAAYCTMFTWALLAVSFFIFSQKVYPMPWLFFIKGETEQKGNA